MTAKKILLSLGITALLYSNSYAQTNDFTNIDLTGLNAFSTSGPNWAIASNAEADINKEGYMKALPGTGAIVNIVSAKNKSHLITKEAFGDIELELDFMMAKQSNSGIYLQGRYEVQLFDSWQKLRPTYIDCAGIYQRWDDTSAGEKGYEGIAPFTNVARAPGLWQHIKIKFRAPRFDDKGVKIENARFEEVYLNGVLVQQQAEVTGPTRSSAFNDEKPTGPVMIQGDHGNVAFRNIRYRQLQPNDNAVQTNDKKGRRRDLPTPIIVNAGARPYLLRSFLNYKNKMLTHGISVANPNQVNYSYDMKTGGLFQVWRGQFADATDLWYERGEPYQRIVPLGSVIVLSDAPAIAVLNDFQTTAWPDSVAFDDMHNKGYALDDNRFPTFKYELNNITVTDKVSVPDASGITRTITVAAPVANLYCRVISAKQIDKVNKETFVIDDKSYYINISEKFKPLIRQINGLQELLIPVTSADPVTYSITW
ncbi:MAG: DUF1080 domain-containing protein [Agriterribacter sp.]